MSGWYLDGKEQLLARTIPQTAGIFMVGVNSLFTFNQLDTDFTNITPHVILPEQELLGLTFDLGLLRSNPSELTWLNAGAGLTIDLELTGVVVYFQEGAVGTLLAFIDSPAVGLPQVLSGVNVTGRWPNGLLQL